MTALSSSRDAIGIKYPSSTQNNIMGPHGVPYYCETALSDIIQSHYAMRITAAAHLHTVSNRNRPCGSGRGTVQNF